MSVHLPTKRLRMVVDVEEHIAWGESPETCANLILSAMGEYSPQAVVIEAEWVDE